MHLTKIYKMQSVEQLGFGGAALSSFKSQAQVINILEKSFDLGLRHYDTAPLYGKGYSEILMGKFIRKRRSQVTITTKFGFGLFNDQPIPAFLALPLNYYKKKLRSQPQQSAPSVPAPVSSAPISKRQVSLQDITTGLAQSLKRLNTDYIDYYLLHEGLPSFLNEDALAELIRLKEKGIVRNIGIAANRDHIMTLTAGDLEAWDVLQYEYNGKEGTDPLIDLFPGKLHFHHSCLKGLASSEYKNISAEDRGGYRLAQCAADNPKGKLLFSTRRMNILQANIAGFKKYTV